MMKTIRGYCQTPIGRVEIAVAVEEDFAFSGHYEPLHTTRQSKAQHSFCSA